MDHLSLALRIGLTVVCLTAAVGKVRRRSAFRAFVSSVEAMVRAVPLVTAPHRFAVVVAGPTVAAELAVAVLLPWPATARAGAVLAVLLFGVLTAAVWFAVATGVPARCACFGRLSRRLGRTHVARNVTLTVAAATCCLPAGVPPWPGVLASSVAGVVFASVVVAWEDLAALVTAVPGVAVRP
jgi:hypothetical protein